jgi:hypothetical protein
MIISSRTGVAAALPVLLVAAAFAVPGGGCSSDNTTFQPDAASDDAASEAGGDDVTTPAIDAAPDALVSTDAGADALATVDAPSGDDADATSGDDADALAPVDAPGEAATCDLGSAGSYATQMDLSLFGQITYFDNGATLPAGHYRVQYLGGCMKYASDQDWTVQAYANGSDAFWLGTATGDELFLPPGTAGYTALDDGGAFTGFDECVAANLALPPKEFDFNGGQLGVWLADTNYGDNLAGVSDDGGIDNPKWALTLLSGSCTNIE